MNAAEQFAVDAMKFMVAKWTARATLIVILGAALLLSYCGGIEKGKADAHAERIADSVRVLKDSSKAIESRIAVRAPAVIAAQNTAVADRVKYHAGRAHIVIASDTTLQIDSVTVDVPAPAIQVIARADTLLVADSIAYHAVAAQLVDMQSDRDIWKARALLDESNQPKRARFGWRSGFVAGVSLTIALIKVLR